MTLRTRIAYPTRLLEGPLREKIEQAAAFGAGGVQLDLRYELRPTELSETGRRQFQRLLQEQGLSLAPPAFPLRRALIEPAGLDERVAAITAAIRLAGDLKAAELIIRPGAIPAPDDGNRSLFIEVLNDLARAGNHVGVTLLLTTGRETPDALVELIQSIDAGPVGANLDPAACVMAGRDPASLAKTLHERLGHVRVRDGLQEADGAGVEVAVGRGEVDWESLFAALAEIGYAGWLTPDRTTGDDPARDAARAIAYVKNVLPF
jgi:L-ribulose-5-phosphate 3-epimerase